MMYKLIDNGSFYKDDEPTVRLLNRDNVSGLTKYAADESITKFVEALSPKPGFFYLHVNALGSGETYGSNRNGDFFPAENLRQHYKTYESGHVFKHHINKNPEKSYGKVIFSIWNDNMKRVELIAEVNRELARDIEERMEAGEHISTSQALKTPSDRCSICGNRARTRQEYCAHLRNELNHLYPDGRRVMALNDDNLKLFDISIVLRPADPTSSVLRKVAFAEEYVISSAELAELEGITEEGIKKASLKKLADIIKEIEGEVDAVSPELDKILFKTKDLDESLIKELRIFNLADTLKVLAELGICPSISFLAELIARKFMGEEGRGLGKKVAEYIKTVDPEHTMLPAVSFGGEDRINPLVHKILLPHASSSSVFPEHVEKRAMEYGYASFNANGIEDIQAPKVPEPHQGVMGMAKTLLTIGGAAILAKMYIASMIEENVKRKFASQNRENSAKILVIKQASDYTTASKLIKAALHKELKKSEDNMKNLDTLASATAFVAKHSRTPLGSKLAKAIKVLKQGSKVIDKQKDKPV